jgi:hypothetical protein
MQKVAPLENGMYYHIYNCGINGEDLFRENDNYEHFLRQYDKYVDPVADTFAWVLMRNHFHFLVSVKEEEKIISFYDSHCQGLQPLTGQDETSAPPVVENPGGGKNKKTTKSLLAAAIEVLINIIEVRLKAIEARAKIIEGRIRIITG